MSIGREKRLAACRKYWSENKEKIKMRQQEYHERHPEKRKNQAKAYRANNLEALRAYDRIRSKTEKRRTLSRDRGRTLRKLDPEGQRKYHMEYARKHWRKYKKKQDEWAKRNPDRILGYCKKWRDANRTKSNAASLKWARENPEKAASLAARRRARIKHAMPGWVDKKAIDAIYAESRRKTAATGIKYAVDHIWPLSGNGFVGLHVPWNLRVIKDTDNHIKHNKRPSCR